MMANQPYKWDVFVSHNRRDKPWVREMVTQLRSYGLQVFFDEDSIPPASDVVRAIGQGIEQSRYLIYVITPSSAASEWVSLETSIRLYGDLSTQTNRLIPLLLEETPEADIRPEVRLLGRIDLIDPQKRGDEYHRLLRHLGINANVLPAPPVREQVPQMIAQVPLVDISLQARKELRGLLTEIACLYYQEVFNDAPFLIAPEEMPVLSLEKLLPVKPVPLAEIDRCLVWENEADFPQSDLEGDMVTFLRSQTQPLQIYDGLIYRFLGWNDHGDFRFCRGSYFGFLNSCDYLSLELARAISDNRFAYEILKQGQREKFSQVVAFLRDNSNLIPLRAALDPLNFATRHNAFGTCALVIVKRTNKPPYMILNLRSQALTETPNLLHVIPAGTFQPNMSDDRFHNKEFSLTENIIREFAEELLDADDLRLPKLEPEPLDVNAMYTNRSKTFRQVVVQNENFSIYYLGTVIDPINLKPEVLTALLLHDGFLFNVDKHELFKSWESGRLSIHAFSENELNYLIGKSNFVPTGKAHLMLVRKHFHFLNEMLSAI